MKAPSNVKYVTVEEGREYMNKLREKVPGYFTATHAIFDKLYKLYCNKKRWNRLSARLRSQLTYKLRGLGSFAKTYYDAGYDHNEASFRMVFIKPMLYRI